MRKSQYLTVIAVMLAIFSCPPALATHAAPSADAVAGRYPNGSIASTRAAQQALADVSAARAEVEARFARDQNDCYAKFFATSCMDRARERRRADLEALRGVEVDANYFLRKERAEERDRALAEKRTADEADRAQREQRAAAETARRQRELEKQQARSAAPQGTPDPGRVARHERKLKEMQARDAAEAAQRKANIAAYERKVREAQERQKEIARRKAEKAKERASAAQD